MSGVRDATTLRRGLDLLVALGSAEALEAGGLGVMQLAEWTGEDKSQVSRALKVLAGTGLVDRDPATQAYSLGWMIYGLAARAGDRRLLLEAPTLLRRLVDELGERAHLSVLQGPEVLTLWTESAPLSVQAMGWVGRTVPAWCTSAGRALLIDHDRVRLSKLFRGVELTSMGRGGPTDVEALYGRIREAAEAGFAMVDEEFEPGLVAVAAPVRGHHGGVIAAINVSGPKFRFGPRLAEGGHLAKQAADGLAALLGGGPPQDASDAPGGVAPSEELVVSQERSTSGKQA